MVTGSLYPFAAATKARAMPVLPLVGSMISIPGLSTPFFSPSQIILAPIRHLTEYEGLRPSIFARIVALSPLAILLILTNGVLPIDNALSSKYLVIVFSFLMFLDGFMTNYPA